MANRYNEIRKRLKTNPVYKYFVIEKIFMDSFSRIVNLLLFPTRLICFGHLSAYSKISLSASFRNHRNIFIHKNVIINKGAVLWAGLENGILIDECSQINPYVTIYGNVKIGKYVMVAPHVMLAGGNHGFKDIEKPMIYQSSVYKGGIEIEDDVWIGANSTIVDGVKIRKGAIIAAGSVVTKNIESYDIVAGIPAIKIKNRLSDSL